MGPLVMVVGALLGMRAFSHDHALDCGSGGGAAASYYAARHVGLPLAAALRRRRTSA